MRLKEYLIEGIDVEGWEDIVPIIERDCKPFLREFNKPLWRAINTYHTELLIKRFVRLEGRKPRGMSFALQNFLDDEFEKKFGWKGRSGGVFISDTQTVENIPGFGIAHLFFPIGGYKYIWSPLIKDINLEGKVKSAINNDNKEEWGKYLESYKSTGFGTREITGCEASFRCKSYYLVNMSSVKLHNEKDVYLAKLGL